MNIPENYNHPVIHRYSYRRNLFINKYTHCKSYTQTTWCDLGFEETPVKYQLQHDDDNDAFSKYC